MKLASLLLTLLSWGCTSTVGAPAGPAGGDGGPVVLTDASTLDASTLDASTLDASTLDASLPPPPVVDPCVTARCWMTGLPLLRCEEATIHENYITGRYDVHRYATRLQGGITTRLSLQRRAGPWQPAMIVTREDGAVIFDGEAGFSDASLAVTVVSNGRDGDIAELSILPTEELVATVFVTAWSIVDAGFVGDMSPDASYTLFVDGLCDGETRVPCVVAGVTLTEPACDWMHLIGRHVVPQLEGDRDTRLTHAARVAWWSLKEAVLSLPNPLAYSNCNFPEGDRHIGPLETCVPMRAWQVGLSGVQAAYISLPATEAITTRVLPGLTLEQALAAGVRDAGLDDASVAAVLAATGKLRVSWLLRHSVVGFTYQAERVALECIDGSMPWCYATPPFASDRATGLRAMDDVRAILAAIAP